MKTAKQAQHRFGTGQLLAAVRTVRQGRHREGGPAFWTNERTPNQGRIDLAGVFARWTMRLHACSPVLAPPVPSSHDADHGLTLAQIMHLEQRRGQDGVHDNFVGRCWEPPFKERRFPNPPSNLVVPFADFAGSHRPQTAPEITEAACGIRKNVQKFWEGGCRANM